MSSNIQRKCPNCETWNNGVVAHCKSCNTLISPEKIKQKRLQEREQEEKEKPLDKMDVYLKSLKENDNLLIKAIFTILYSVWFIFMLIVSIVVYTVALTPG